MSQLRVIGGKRLEGCVAVSGTKNAALPILFATVPIKGECVIRNLPKIRDVSTVLDLLTTMGAVITRGDGWARIDTRRMHPLREDPRTAMLRGSLYLLGSSVARFGEATFGSAGGCDFGGRPFDYHVRLLEAMGCRSEMIGGNLSLTARCLRGCRISLPYPSVGATCNGILAAMGAEGETVIDGAAEEPHVWELCCFLKACGASIRKEGASIYLSADSLHGTDYTLSGDAIEAGTYLAATLGTGGEMRVEGFTPSHLGEALSVLRNMGAEIDVMDSAVTIHSPKRIRGGRIETAPFPGFPTDLHPVFAVLLALSEGGGRIYERVFQERFRYLTELNRMGVHVCVEGDAARFSGGDRLRGASVTVPDLRGGAALLMAALCAEGESVLEEAQILRRGYSSFPEKLRGVGACIQ